LPFPGRTRHASHRPSRRHQAGTIALAVALGMVWIAAGTASPAAAASGPKVAIIVGPAGSQTAGYKDWANAAAREARLHTPNVVRVYSPYATWSRVKAAMTGASIVVYVGRGYGFPAPSSAVLLPLKHDGFGLNPVSGRDNSTTRYYGEAYVRTVELAPNAIVLLHHTSYASGSSPAGYPEPTLTVARRRVDNYGAGFLAAGASAVITEASYPPTYYIQAIFTRNASLDAVWRGAPSFHGHVTSLSSSRTRGAIGRTDPVRTGTGYSRSIIGWPATQTSTVRQEPAGCAGTLQAGIDAAAAGSVLDLTGCTYAAGATVTKPLTIVGATIRPAAGTAGLVVKASDVTLDGLHLIGPQATTYRDGEFGITVMATASAPARRLTIRNSEIASFGKAGMWLRYVSDLVVEHNDVHDIVYAGIMVISGTGGRISENTVARIGVHGAEANDNNAYGISLEDQGLPVTTDFTVSGNTVTGVPTWHGLDTHGGQRIAFTGNAVSGAPRALFITTGSGRPTDITVSGNLFGSPAPATDNLLAVTTYDSVNVTVTGNTAAGWPAGQFFEDYRGLSTGLVVSGNTETP